MGRGAPRPCRRGERVPVAHKPRTDRAGRRDFLFGFAYAKPTKRPGSRRKPAAYAPLAFCGEPQNGREEAGLARFLRRFVRRTNPSGAPDAKNGAMRWLSFVRRHEFSCGKLAGQGAVHTLRRKPALGAASRPKCPPGPVPRNQPAGALTRPYKKGNETLPRLG